MFLPRLGQRKHGIFCSAPMERTMGTLMWLLSLISWDHHAKEAMCGCCSQAKTFSHPTGVIQTCGKAILNSQSQCTYHSWIHWVTSVSVTESRRITLESPAPITVPQNNEYDPTAMGSSHYVLAWFLVQMVPGKGVLHTTNLKYVTLALGWEVGGCW